MDGIVSVTMITTQNGGTNDEFLREVQDAIASVEYPRIMSINIGGLVIDLSSAPIESGELSGKDEIVFTLATGEATMLFRVISTIDPEMFSKITTTAGNS
jgi:hypothetical protein